MKMKFFSLFLLSLLTLVSKAQVNPGSRITATGLTGVVMQDAWSLQANPAGLAALRKPVISGAFESKFEDAGLSEKSAVFAYPVKQNVFGLSFRNYGFSAYNEQKAGFAYAKRFGNSLFAALSFNYYQLKIPKYGKAQSFTVEAGLQYRATEKLLIGAHIANPNRNGYDNQVSAVIPVLSEFGLAYRVNTYLSINSAFVKELNSPADARLGLEYYPAEWFALRGGFSANPLRQFVGFGLKYQKLGLDVAASSHPILGYSPQVALSYEF